MEQGGFDFQRPSERREAKQFEPPPWEQEAFEELRRRREGPGEGPAHEDAPASEQVEGLGEAGVNEAVRPTEVPVVGSKAPDDGSSGEDGEAAAQTKGQLDEAQMIELMAGLAIETPRSRWMAANVTMAVGIALFAMGLAMAIWGLSATAKVEGTARMLAMMLVVMGLAFAGVGVAFGYRALKERGVL